jgi:two-component system, NarL family, invasion response regulator UvrY
VISVIIAEDHTIVRQGLEQLLAEQSDIEVAGVAANGDEALAQIRSAACDVLLLDLNMPGPHGIDLIEQIKSERPALQMLVLSMHREEQFALRALKAGATGYLTKDSAVDELVVALRKVATGETYICASIAQALALDMLHPRCGSAHDQLSSREYSVLVLVARGQALNDIAEQLHLSAKTISTYKARLMEKMGFANNAELIRYAAEHQLMQERRDLPAANG